MISSARGVQEAAIACTYSLEQYKVARTSDDFALRQRRRAGRGAGVPEIAALAPRDVEGRTKALRVRLELERSVFHEGQLLDRLAACVAIVGGLSIELLPISWRHIQSRVKNGLPAPRGLGDSQTSEGRERQSSLLRKIRGELTKDSDAFDWMWQYRNSVLHRSEMISWGIQALDGRHHYKMISPLPRQPDWAFHEAMVNERDSMEGLVILKDPEDVLNGLWDLTASLSVSVIDELSALWLERRQDPTLILQPGKQWPAMRDRALYDFDGFGEPLVLAKNMSIHIAPTESRRMRSAKIFEADANVWDT